MSDRSGKEPTQRQLRVGEELRQALAQMLERGDLHDSDLAGKSITVTEIKISPDLKNATAYVTPLGGGDATKIVEALNRAKSYIRTSLARSVRLKFAPRISFMADTAFDYSTHMDNVLSGLQGQDED